MLAGVTIRVGASASIGVGGEQYAVANPGEMRDDGTTLTLGQSISHCARIGALKQAL